MRKECKNCGNTRYMCTQCFLTVSITDYEHLLNELLAVIHRDGGHYVQEHGIEKAVEDAIILINKERSELTHISTAALENELLDRRRKERLCRSETAEEEQIFEEYFSKFEVKEKCRWIRCS